MYLDDQRIGTGDHARLGDRGDQAPLAGAMGRIGHNGQMAHILQHRDSVDVEGVARRRLVGADAPFAEHHIHVAAVQNILGPHQQFLDCAAGPPLQKDRFLLLAYCL